jgi:hypothetical protein
LDLIEFFGGLGARRGLPAKLYVRKLTRIAGARLDLRQEARKFL